MPYRRKLIEVALPLEAINAESAREKSIRHGHPSTLHLWWARRPLAACRAVLFAQLVDDPSEYMPDEESANAERERLFKIIEDLVKWENINNEEVLDKAKLEIARSVARDLGVDVPVGKQAIREFLATKAPPVLDPFAGGGSIPLEAQRLGLRAYASDLNPVAVLINKALIEIPPKFAGLPPVHPPENEQQQLTYLQKEWKGAEGLAEDVRYYGKWMRDEAFKRIGHLYPPVKITEEILAERPDLQAQGLKPGDELTVIAWLWARTIKCFNPACGAQMPLVKSFVLSAKKGKETWVEPIIDKNQVHFTIKTGVGKPPDGTVNRNGAGCICCGTPIPFDYVRAEGKAGRMATQLMAIAADSKHGRIYVSANAEHEEIATQAYSENVPDTDLPEQALGFRIQNYGMTKHRDLFTQRQLVALTTLSDLISKVCERIVHDAQAAGKSVQEAQYYANAIATYLAFVIDKQADLGNSLCRWEPVAQCPRLLFVRHSISMLWDFAEGNVLGESSGSFKVLLDGQSRNLLKSGLPQTSEGKAKIFLASAQQIEFSGKKIIISTDPPYYDNVPYSDLSDFFYIWLRRSLQSIYPQLFNTLLVPKADELVAEPFRHGNKEKARSFFEKGIAHTFERFREISDERFPTTIYYAFKQTEETGNEDNEEDDNRGNTTHSSTGWETFLTGLIKAGWQVNGTWPIRTELSYRVRSQSSNALASSIVLVCRPRLENAPTTTRRDFLATIKRELPLALRQLQQGSIAPVDLAQAAIGPGMAVFSRYKQVLEANGSPMRVRTALALINQSLDEFLAEQEGEYDGDTRWALAWYEQYSHEQGPYGVAETLSKAKNTSVEGLVEASILEARAGKVRLLRRDELAASLTPGPSPKKGEGGGWDPEKDKRPTAWEACQHLIFELDRNGEQAAAVLLAKLGGLSETARDLAYRLYTICERKGWAQDALGYNMLVVAWPRLRELARAKAQVEQDRLL